MRRKVAGFPTTSETAVARAARVPTKASTFRVSRGADLYAVVTGQLTKQYVDSGLTYGAGNGWTLEDEENNITYKYFHMATHAEGLAEGDIVMQGDVIGTVGNTGTSGVNDDSNYHLHFEYRPNNVAQDPLPLLVRPDSCTFYDGY